MVKGAVADLIERQKVPPSDIAVLTGGRVAGNPMVSGRTISGVPFSPAGKGGDGRLIFDTVRRFKGLDRPVVLLTDIEELTEPELIYVALTRPTVLLLIFGSQVTLERIKSGPVGDDLD
jgi:superfamily I DNA/RNA helicase